MTEAVELQQETGYHLVATDKPQLEAAHGKMIEWARGQQQRMDVEQAEAAENLRIAEERKWSTAAFKRQINALAKRRVFYEKIEIALHAGYVIVPNFEMNVFAIRTNASAPRKDSSTYRHTAFRQQIADSAAW